MRPDGWIGGHKTVGEGRKKLETSHNQKTKNIIKCGHLLTSRAQENLDDYFHIFLLMFL